MGWAILYFILALITGFIGARIARRKGRDTTVWFLICALTGGLGIIALLIGEDAPDHAPRQLQTFRSLPPLPSSKSARTPPYDAAKWKTLLEVDPELRARHDEIAVFGPQYVEAFASKYMQLSDRSYTSMIADAVLKIAHDDGAKKENAFALMPDDARARYSENLSDSRSMIETLRQNRNFDYLTNKRVRDMSIYDGKVQSNKGGLLLTFADGSIEVRAGSARSFYTDEGDFDARERR